MKLQKNTPEKSNLKHYKLIEIISTCLESQYDLPCYSELCEDGSFDVRICAPLSLFIKIFEVAHTHELSGHRAESTTYSKVKRYFYWPGMFKWIEMLMLDCLSCQTNKSARKDLHYATELQIDRGLTAK